MGNFWDKRYSATEYAYGEKPNHFMVEKLGALTPGKILFPAEGEGRNAVYAATRGWEVTAFDPSIEGRDKALQLAKQHNATIDYHIENYETVDFPKESFDCIILIFAHIHSANREKYHKKLVSYLKPGGHLILEGFSKDQLSRNTGGPKDLEMLYSKSEMANDFEDFDKLKILETETILNEGKYHNGKASVIRLTGIKKRQIHSR